MQDFKDIGMARLYSITVAFGLLLILGCVTPSTLMVNRDGQVMRCATTGYGYGIAGAIAMTAAQSSHNRCVKDAETLGYVPIPPVTLGFQADLKTKPMRVTQTAANAESAGMKVGDLLMEIDSKPVENYYAVLQIINGKQVGDKVPVKVKRDDQPISMVIEVAER